MKILTAGALALLFLIPATILLRADDHETFEQAMKTMRSATQATKKGLDAKSAEPAAAEAANFEKAFVQAEEYFRSHGKPEKVAAAFDFLSQGQMASKKLGEAAKAGNLDGTAAAFKEIGGTCQGCHDQYRERTADGKYKFKNLE